MNACLLDSNMIIYHLQGALEEKEEAFLIEALTADAHISVISRIEVLGWRGHTDESLEKAQQFLNGLYEIPLTEEIVATCISMKQNLSIKLPDAVIAATALQLSMPLMTRNTADFEHVPDLQLFNPFDGNDRNTT
ncbi:MAG: type II toxin-antitoxin system VapC family toxin [Gammaproteobacteria bacterium]|nr:type II toxin-antitoxin system VapC family toxin [Gammaproteobacteria bacterium]